MTRWGLLLLIAYVGLGLSSIEIRAAMRYAVLATAVVVAVAGVQMGMP